MLKIGCKNTQYIYEKRKPIASYVYCATHASESPLMIFKGLN